MALRTETLSLSSFANIYHFAIFILLEAEAGMEMYCLKT